MQVCHCSLAGTSACAGCFQNPNAKWFSSLDTHYQPIRKNKRVIEKFNQDGKLIERITEE